MGLNAMVPPSLLMRTPVGPLLPRAESLPGRVSARHHARGPRPCRTPLDRRRRGG